MGIIWSMRKVVWLHGTSSVVHVGSGDKISQIKDTLSTLLTPHALAQKSRNRVSVTFVILFEKNCLLLEIER